MNKQGSLIDRVRGNHKRLWQDFCKYKWWQQLAIGWVWVFYPLLVLVINHKHQSNENIWET